MSTEEILMQQLREASASPHDENLWNALEDTARTLQRPDEVDALYREVLARSMERATLAALGQRAVTFHDEWSSDTDALIALLDRVSRVDPGATWAFERLTMLYTVAERWNDLLDLYDRAIEATPVDDRERRASLFDEAAHVAKDFADQPERAIRYLEGQFSLDHDNTLVARSLERLYERYARHRELIALWTARIEFLAPDAAQASRARIAQTWLDPLGDAAAALDATETLLREGGDETMACTLLERIAAVGSPAVARRAVTTLRDRYDAAGRSDDVLRVLAIALRVAENDAARAHVHREMAERLLAAGRERDAADHVAELLVLEPSDRAHLTRLTELSERTQRHEPLATALARAADALGSRSDGDRALRLDLLVRAATVRADVLRDAAGAAALFSKVLASPDAPTEVALPVARRLSTLLADSGEATERLDVLERLATLEPDVTARRNALGEAARLAEAAGNVDRSLAAWHARVDADPSDAEALDALVALLTRTERWEPLIDVLRARTEVTRDQGAKRADFVRIADIYARELGRIDDAIAAWDVVRTRFGEDADTVDSLVALLGAAQRDDELLALLDRASSREENALRRAVLLRRAGDVHRARNEGALSLARYRAALDADAAEEGARSGLRTLLDDAGAEAPVGAEAVAVLAEAYARTDDWQLTLDVLEQRVTAAPDRVTRARLLLEAAALQERRAENARAALSSAGRAMPLAIDDDALLRTTEAEVHRLAARGNDWQPLVLAYKTSIRALDSDAPRVARLSMRLGDALETHVLDLAGALDAYERVIAAEPSHGDAPRAVVRVGGRIGRWDSVARALVQAATRKSLDGRLTAVAEEAAEAAQDPATAWSSLALLVEEATRDAAPDAAIARDLEAQIAVWHRDRRQDTLAAEAALVRAVAHDGAHAPTLRMLASIQRGRPSSSLVGTLLALGVAEPDELDAMAAQREAATVALEGLRDSSAARAILTRLLERAAMRWRELVAEGVTEGTLLDTVRDHGTWSLRSLVDLCVERGEHARAVEMLIEASKMPFTPEEARTLRHEAAERAARDLHDGEQAATLYRGILKEAPHDVRAIERLGALHRAAERYADLLALREHELSITRELTRRLALRLDMAEIHAALGDETGRADVLEANLSEHPGHGPSIEALANVLDAAGKHRDLLEMLTEQASILEVLDDHAQRSLAARLWSRAAALADQRLGDPARAIAAHERVVSLEPDPVSLDALARMHSTRGEHAEAVRYLERRLEAAVGHGRHDTVTRLARALLAMRQPDRARAVLEQFVADEPEAREARTLLADLYRKAEAWEPLATLLTDAVGERNEQLASLREAADVLMRRLREPARAVPVLERASVISPDDRAVRASLADALRAAGRFDEARVILDALVEGYGRQRPVERAVVHYQIARIAAARGENAEALSQLELASTIDMGHAGIFRMLGDLSRDAGQLDRAERAYRALLMIARRQASASTQSSDTMGPSEVLYALHDVAKRLGQTERAQETLESAFELASRSDLEAQRFERALRAAGDTALLLRALEGRLAVEQDPDRTAELVAEMAGAYESLGRREEALDARLRAIAYSPDAQTHHEAARALARDTRNAARYVSTLRELIDAARAEERDVGDLQFRLGEVYDEDLDDVAHATEAYAAAESALSGEELLATLRALDRLYGRAEDADGSIRVLRRLIDADPRGAIDSAWRLGTLLLMRDDEEARNEGITWISWALERDPDQGRAIEVLREALASHPEHEPSLDLYLRVAREHDDLGVLLDALTRRVSRDDATTELLREAVDLAIARDDMKRAEQLLQRAVALGEARGNAHEAAWALVQLGERAREAGDLPNAVRWLRRAAEVTDGPEGYSIGMDVASLAAGPLNDLRLASEVYETLRVRDPSDRTVWEPLLDVYRMLGDRAALARLIDETVGHVYDRNARNRLRMERARILQDENRDPEAVIRTLRDVLEEDADDVEATNALADIYERLERNEDLAELLMRSFDQAKDQGDANATSSLARRLAALLAPSQRERAIEVLRSGLDVAPESPELLHALLASFNDDDDAGERAAFMERLLSLETGPAAAKLALDLARVRSDLGDDAAVERALELGFRKVPTDAALRDHLEERYQARQDYDALARLREIDATHQSATAVRVAGLRAAAAIRRDELGQHAQAASLLVRARKDAPTDVELLNECVASLTAAEQFQSAIDEVSSAIDAGVGDTPELLRLRAHVRSQGNDEHGAIVDLERALAEGGGTAAAVELAAALDRTRLAASHGGDRVAARTATLRLIDVLPTAGDGERANALLAEWAAVNPSDVEVLRRVAIQHEQKELWADASEVWARLVEQLAGPERSEAALRLADACERAERPLDAREPMEIAWRGDRENAALRQRLRALYASQSLSRDVALLWIDEAQFAADDGARFDALKRAGEAWLDQAGDPTQAVEVLERALTLKAHDHEVTVLLADAYTMNERLEEATRLLEEAMALHKGRRSKELAVLQQRMGHVAYAAGDHQVEMAWLNAALDTDMQNGQIAAELADAAMENSNFDVALKALRAVTLMKNPAPMTRAQAFLRQGFIASNQGDPKKAAFLARKALSEDSSLEEAQRFLAQLGGE
jgi:tetratricopeptide (TPR) repeat protein